MRTHRFPDRRGGGGYRSGGTDDIGVILSRHRHEGDRDHRDSRRQRRPTPTHPSGRARDASAAGPASNPRRRLRFARGRQAESSWRSPSSSFASMFPTWYLTAATLIPRRIAISALVAPVRSSSSTRHSAGVSTSGWGGRPRRRPAMGTNLAAGEQNYPRPVEAAARPAHPGAEVRGDGVRAPWRQRLTVSGLVPRREANSLQVSPDFPSTAPADGGNPRGRHALRDGAAYAGEARVQPSLCPGPDAIPKDHVQAKWPVREAERWQERRRA